MTAGIAQSERSVTSACHLDQDYFTWKSPYLSRGMKQLEVNPRQTGRLVQNQDIGVQRPSVEWTRYITEKDRIFNLVLNYDEVFTGHIDDLILSARQIITNHRARTASQMEEEGSQLKDHTIVS